MAGNGNGDLRRASALAKRIRSVIVSTRDDSFEHAWATMELHKKHRPPDVEVSPIQRSQIGPQLSEVSGELNALLSETTYEDSVDQDLARSFGTSKRWSLGTELEVFPPRKIVRGYLIPARELPTRVRVSLAVFAFLTIHGDKDLLHRDSDKFGIHYHYVLANKVRTTTMICWDTRWVSDDPTEPKGLELRPIFHELHGEGRYTKTARPRGWAHKKRKSVRAACVPDLRKWDIQAFRCASNDAVAVWPINAALSPRLEKSTSKKSK